MSKQNRQVTPSEFEAKCTNPGGEVSPEDLARLLREHFQLEGEIQHFYQTDVYYDTTSSPDLPRFHLGGSGLSLRVRSFRGGDSYELTAKRNISEIGGVFVREEVPAIIPLSTDISYPINDQRPKLPPLLMIRKYISGKLSPVVMVENHRMVIRVEIEGLKMKICHDTVTYQDFLTNLQVPDHEIEIELRGLNAQLMEDVVRLVREKFPKLVAQREDKYRRALELLFGEPKHRSLSYVPPSFEIVSHDDIERCLTQAPEPYRPLLEKLVQDTTRRLSYKSQLSVLPMPTDVRLALWQERTIANLIEANPFLYSSDPVLADSCFIAVDLPESPLRFFEHTRAQHSIDVATWAMTLARKCGFGTDSIVYVGCAGLRHDLGHPALCHSGEIVAKDVCGLDHEERTLQLVDADAPILSRYDLDIEKLKAILREEDIGQILALADTLAYLIRDGQACERPLDPSVPRTIAEHFDYDSSSNEIIFDDELISALQTMLDFRFEMFRTVYYHPYSRIEEEMQQKAIRWALSQGVIIISDLLEGDDPTLLKKMAEMAANDPKLKQLVAGFFPDYCAVYHYRPHITYKGAIDAASMDKALVDAGFDPLDYIISLPDTRAHRKTIRGRRLNGESVELSARNVRNFHQYDSQTIIAFAPTLKQQDILRTFLHPR